MPAKKLSTTSKGKAASNTKPGRRSKPIATAIIRAKAVATATRAGLLFSVPRVTKLMRRDRLAVSVGTRPAVAMAAVVEYIASEILELAGNVC